MPIYTKSGDAGITGLANGQRVPKDSKVIEFVGTLDELNASIGICVSLLEELDDTYDFSPEVEILEEIQNDLFIVGAISVGANLSFNSDVETSNIEKTIDDYERLLPKLKNFILPGGSSMAAQVHLTRTLVRRIERSAVALKSPSILPFLPYLNRLSDLLFVVGRYINYRLGVKEQLWKS